MPRLPGAAHLLPYLTIQNQHLTDTARQIGKQGTESEKSHAAARLIGLAEVIASDEWRTNQLPVVQRLRSAPLRQREAQTLLDDWQRRHWIRAYDAMGALGGETVLAHCRAVVDNPRRQLSQKRLASGVLSPRGQKTQGAWGMPAAPAPAQGALAAQPQPAPTNGQPPTTWGQPPTVSRPAAQRRADAPIVKRGHIIGVDQVVDQLRPHFTMCYRRALADFGRFGAWTMITTVVGADGRVGSVHVQGDGSEPYPMMACLRNVVSAARFAPPQGGEAVVSIPLTFTAPVQQTATSRPPANPRRAGAVGYW